MHIRPVTFIALLLGTFLAASCGNKQVDPADPARPLKEVQSTQVKGHPRTSQMSDATPIGQEQFQSEYDKRGSFPLLFGDSYVTEGQVVFRHKLSSGEVMDCILDVKIEGRIAKAGKLKIGLEGHENRTARDQACRELDVDQDFEREEKIEQRDIDFKVLKNVQIHKGHYRGLMHYSISADVNSSKLQGKSRTILHPKLPPFLFSYLMTESNDPAGIVRQELYTEVSIQKRR